jgi:hypothetical protein
MCKENCKGEGHSELPRDPLGGPSSLISHHHSCTTSRQTTPATINNADKAASATKGFQKTDLSVQAPSSSNNDTIATVVHQIMTKLIKAVSEEDRVMVITKLVLI